MLCSVLSEHREGRVEVALVVSVVQPFFVCAEVEEVSGVVLSGWIYVISFDNLVHELLQGLLDIEEDVFRDSLEDLLLL